MGRPLEPQPALGEAVRRLRADRRISQEQLAHDAATSTSNISKIERGLANPSWTIVDRIAEALGTTKAELAALAERLER